MRRTIIGLLVLLLVVPALVGCKETKKDLEEYGNTVMSMPEKARVLSDVTRIRRAIEFYKVENEGKYPDSISELNLKDLYYDDEYDYDSSTGKLRSKNYPTL
jgi:hypothetical protein